MDVPEVLIVGAGPTGLALGCGLLLHGVRVRMVDAAPGPARTSRANFLHARGSEVLDRLGALGDLPERAISALSITVRVGDETVSTMRFGDPGLRTAAPALFASQEIVERVLRERFEALGGTVGRARCCSTPTRRSAARWPSRCCARPAPTPACRPPTARWRGSSAGA